MNEMIVTEIERVRASREDDKSFHEQFVRDNIEGVLALELPARLEEIQDHWEEIAEHVAPAAVRMAQRSQRRPLPLSEILSEDVWTRLRGAVEAGDPTALHQVLSEAEDALIANLRLRLTVKAEYQQPVSEIRFRGGPDRFFDEAQKLLLKQDSRALVKFRNIHFNKSDNPIANEWYAYALTRFGTAADIFEIIELLEEALASTARYYNEAFRWTARWNLACALRRLRAREGDALDSLLPTLQLAEYPPEVLELCVLWTLEDDDEEIARDLMWRLVFHEAQLLAALYVLRSADAETDFSSIQTHFRRIAWILREPDYLYPDPKERLEFAALEGLTRHFIEAAMVDAGIEWFRQRLSYRRERVFFKNWDYAAMLFEAADRSAEAWNCRKESWETTRRNRRATKEQKARSLTALLRWAQRNDFSEAALRILRQSWRDASLEQSDVLDWENRLTPSVTGATRQPNPVPPGSSGTRSAGADSTPGSDSEFDGAVSPANVEGVIQSLAGSFGAVRTAEELAGKQRSIEQLLAATEQKHGALPVRTKASLLQIEDIAQELAHGVGSERAAELANIAKENLQTLREVGVALPYELRGLCDAEIRVAQHIAVTSRSVTQLSLTPPADLGFVLFRPNSNGKYETHLPLRLANPGNEMASDIVVSLTSAEGSIAPAEQELGLSAIAQSSSVVVSYPLTISDPLPAAPELGLHVSFQAGGVRRAMRGTIKIPVGNWDGDIPVSLRYETASPVASDREDLFHGRDRELKELLDAFADGKLQRLYFINGIRAVGKSTLMIHLVSRRISLCQLWFPGAAAGVG